VPGRVTLVAGDLDHELLLDGLDHPLDLFPGPAPRLAVGQLHAQDRAGPLQRLVGITRAVVAVEQRVSEPLIKQAQQGAAHG
jgi:hypothetical protein